MPRRAPHRRGRDRRAVNVEEPDLFNRITADFLALVDSDAGPRDGRSPNKSTMAKTIAGKEMPYANSRGVRLYEEAGRGAPIVFVHEFSGDFRSWEAQLRFFSRRYRCIAFNARGYPPSEVPASPSQYSHTIATDDIRAVMRHLGISKAHIIGCSMGAYATIMFGLRYPRNALSLTTVGAGAGGILDPGQRAQFLKNTEANARRYEEEGLEAAARLIRKAPNRIQLENKDPRGFLEFFQRFAEHSALGHANAARRAARRRRFTRWKAVRGSEGAVPRFVGDEDESASRPVSLSSAPARRRG
jgi:pimeloyl-ACP methyl ester carboxylesterase